MKHKKYKIGRKITYFFHLVYKLLFIFFYHKHMYFKMKTLFQFICKYISRPQMTLLRICLHTFY